MSDGSVSAQQNVGFSFEIAGWKLSATTSLRVANALDQLGTDIVELARLAIDVEGRKALKEADLALVRAEFDQKRKALDQKHAAAINGAEFDAIASADARSNVREAVAAACIHLSNSGPAMGGEADYAENIDSTWLNYWREYARKASSVDLHRLWGMILAGELVEPKRFSLATLRIVSELRPSDAILFERFARERVDDEGILMPAGYGNDAAKAKTQRDMAALEDAGLLRIETLDRGIPPTIRGEPGRHPIGDTRNYSFRYATVGMFGVAIRSKSGSGFNYAIFPFTSTGREIASLVPIDEKATLQRLFRYNYTSGLEVRIVERLLKLEDPNQVVALFDKGRPVFSYENGPWIDPEFLRADTSQR